MVSNFTHQLIHAATILTTFAIPNESNDSLINRVISDNNLIIEFTKLLSSDYTIDFVRALLLNNNFKETLKNIRGDK